MNDDIPKLALVILKPTQWFGALLLIAVGFACSKPVGSTLTCGCKDDGSARHMEIRAVDPETRYLDYKSLNTLLEQKSDLLRPATKFHIKEVFTYKESWGPRSYISSGNVPSPETEKYLIGFRLCMDGELGAKPITYSEYTRNVQGQQVAFLFEGQVLASAIVESELPPRGHLSGPDGEGFDQKTANDIAARMRP